MMNDKELLELAAKAAGLAVEWSELYQRFERFVDGTYMDAWDPLTDDGDALRLAVKLEIDVTHYQNSVEAIAWIDGELSDFISEEIAACRIFATRRAIVRAAAAIGEKL